MLTAADKVRAALEALAPTQEKVDLAVRTAIEVAQPSRVILFGSWPRGEAKWDSDLDMAVLMPEEFLSDLGEIHRRIRRRLHEIPMTIDLVVTTEGTVESFRGEINSIYYQILTQGRPVYERKAADANAGTADQSH
jgi:predicted nucleotidyltransferase